MTQYYRQAASMMLSTDNISAGDSHAAYLREYRKRKWFEEIIVTVYPNEQS
jgi:hypothetical protein